MTEPHDLSLGARPLKPLRQAASTRRVNVVRVFADAATGMLYHCPGSGRDAGAAGAGAHYRQ